MRNAKRLSLLLCLAALALSAQETRLAGPVSGILFDPQAHALRPVVGILGASYLGDPLADGVDFASVSPDGRTAVAVRQDQTLLLAGLNDGRIESRSIDTAAPTHAAWSADSSALALWNDAGHLEVWTGLTSSARRMLSADLGALNGVAVDARGALAAAASGAVYVLAENAAARQILQLDRPTAVAIAGDTAYVADAARNEILALRNFREAGDAQLFAGAARGVNDPVALAVSPDRKALLVAGGSARSLTAFDLATSEITGTTELDFEPTCLDRFSASLYELAGGGAGAPFQVLDASRSLAVYFVPDQPASEMED